MLWSAISFWISWAPENNFVLQPVQRSPPQFPALEPNKPVATAAHKVSSWTALPLSPLSSFFLSCVFCGRVPGLRKRAIVGCNAGFEGSGLTGKWGCYKTEGDIDGYWKATGLPWLARKGLQLMDWGAGKNQNIREFSQDGDSIKMEYSFDGPGLGGLGFIETYTVGNGIQEITRMGGAKILVNPAWESDSVLRVQNMNPAKQTQGWAKTLLSGSNV